MNIVFDLGGVLLRWNPKAVIAKYFFDQNEQDIVEKKIFGHHDWLELDRGTLPLEEAISRAVARTELEEKSIARFLNFFSVELSPEPDVLSIVQKLYDSQQHKLYVLSNMHLSAVDYIEREYNFWYFFEGIVFSSRLRMIKPDPEIYHHLLKKYDLRAEDSIFIDDREENIVTAEELGFKTIRFQDASQCEVELKAKLG